MKIKTYVEQLTPQTYKKLRAISLTTCRLNDFRADEATQNACLKMLQSNTDADNSKAFAARSVINATLRAGMKVNSIEKREVFVEHETLTQLAYTYQPIVNEEYEQELQYSMFIKAVKKLPKQQQKIIKHVIKGNSVSKTATLININYNTAKAHYTQAVARLRSLLRA